VYLTIILVSLFTPLTFTAVGLDLPLPQCVTVERNLGSVSGSILGFAMPILMIMLWASIPILWKVRRSLGIVATVALIILLYLPTILVVHMNNKRNSEPSAGEYRP